MEAKIDEKKVLEKGKSYPAVLEKVEPWHDDIRGTYAVGFVYKVYLDNSKTVEVVDNYYFWDSPGYRNNTIGKLTKTASAYNLLLIYKDYRNEVSITNAFSWLVGTRVELSSYRYKGTRYKVISTERKDSYRVNILWECLRENNIDGFEEELKRDEEERVKLMKQMEIFREEILHNGKDNLYFVTCDKNNDDDKKPKKEKKFYKKRKENK